MKRLYFVFYESALTLLITALMIQPAISQNMNDNGASHRVDAIGKSTDLILPYNSNIASIYFQLVGGDGGYARVHDNVFDVTVKANGGGGAYVTATFPVGTGSGKIPRGSTIRFVEGEKGVNGTSTAIAGSGYDFGGGGGGTAILYREPSSSSWTILAVAGGGGGAYQGMFGGGSVDHQPGQPGRTGTSGGSGNGDLLSSSGGADGYGGGGESVGEGGGVRDGISSFHDGAYSYNSNVIGLGVSFTAGGAGFGCGGYGLGDKATLLAGAGGGGGYSGGGFGGRAGRGGGGGSYVNGTATTKSFQDQGTDPTPDNGWIEYQINLNEPPVARCKAAKIYLDPDGKATLTAADINNGSSDPDGYIAKYSLSKSSFDCSDIGSSQVTLTVTDNDGTTDNCQATVTVEDNFAPTAECRRVSVITVQLDANGEASIVPGDVNFGSFDACGIASMSVTPNSFNCTNVGSSLPVTLTVKDASGNESSCTSRVKVEDNIPPKITCSGDVTQDNGPDMCGAIVSFNVTATDNCSAVVTYSPASGSFFPVGTTTVTATATDPSGNTTECTFDVTIEDAENPTFTSFPANITQDNDPGMCGAVVTFSATATDNCGATVNYSQNPGTFFPVGTTTVNVRVSDNAGNYVENSLTVTVNDNEKPEAVCKDTTLYLDENGEAAIVAGDVNDGSTDNCEIETYEIDIDAFECGDVDNPVAVTLRVTDRSGNDGDCVATVTVLDTVSPLALCKNITIQLDAVGQASVDATDIDDGSTDACGIASYVASKTDFTCADLGSNTVTLTVTDVNGNSATCNAIITVEDNILPIVRTRSVTVILDDEGEGYVTPQMIDNGSTDNCTIVDMWLEGETDYDCGDAGEHEVVLKVEDQSGNVGSYNAFVTVKIYEPDFSNIRGVANGDTIHRVACQVPWGISFNDLHDYKTIIQYGSLTTQVYKESLPENAPWGMYSLWRYEYVVKDACYHTYRFNYYVALYDLAPPIYQNFPNDTTVATLADVPPVDAEVKIIDVCQYAVWYAVMTTPVLHPESGDTLGFTRRWMARDPSGHESFKDQMIWVDSGDRNQYSLITGRIADEDRQTTARFSGEAGMNGLPVSLYRLDTDAGTRTRVNSWTTGDWMGAQGTYYFAPEHPGRYQVKIDTTICLVDTLTFNKWLWSDTLVVVAGVLLDQGWIISQECVDPEPTGAKEALVLGMVADPDQLIQNQRSSDKSWRVYPNPTNGYLRLSIYTDHQLSYHIYDALGRSVKTGIYQQGQTIDVRGLNSGLYHLQLREGKELLGTERVLLME